MQKRISGGEKMKKILPGLLCAILGIILGAGCLLLVLNISPAARETFITAESGEESAGCAESNLLVQKAQNIAGLIKNGDFEGTAEYVHPEYGVYVSPTANISLSSNKRFTAKEVAGFADDAQSYVWGVDSDLGAPIEMTAKDFFTKHLFNADYTMATLIGVNTVVKTGNALDNVEDIFPEADFIDLFVPGTKEMEYADWSILRLVFEEYNGEYMLVAVIHSDAAL